MRSQQNGEVESSPLDKLKHSLRAYGSNAGAFLLCQPFETIRSQSQVTGHTRNRNFRHLARDVIKKQGVRGLWRGLGASLVTQPVYWSLFFPLHDYLERNTELPGFVTANLAGSAGIVLTNPLWVMRTRMQTEVLAGDRNKYLSFFSKVIRTEGIQALYKGVTVTLVKNLQMGIQIPLYKTLRSEYEWNPFISGFAAKAAASTLVYPLDTIRTNIRATKDRVGWAEIIRRVLKREGGIRNFYRGIGLYYMSQVPIFAITMVLYEASSTALSSDDDDNDKVEVIDDED